MLPSAWRTSYKRKWGVANEGEAKEEEEEAEEAKEEEKEGEGGKVVVGQQRLHGRKSEAVKLLIALLFKEGGNQLVQAKINEHLDTHDSSAFFMEAKATMTRLMEWHSLNPVGEA